MNTWEERISSSYNKRCNTFFMGEDRRGNCQWKILEEQRYHDGSICSTTCIWPQTMGSFLLIFQMANFCLLPYLISSWADGNTNISSFPSFLFCQKLPHRSANRTVQKYCLFSVKMSQDQRRCNRKVFPVWQKGVRKQVSGKAYPYITQLEHNTGDKWNTMSSGIKEANIHTKTSAFPC